MNQSAKSQNPRDIDYEWGWRQIERHLEKHYGAAANICNIASHIKNRSVEWTPNRTILDCSSCGTRLIERSVKVEMDEKLTRQHRVYKQRVLDLLTKRLEYRNFTPQDIQWFRDTVEEAFK